MSIEPQGFGPYYDLTVPGDGNYLAEGVWNHNSGKTRAGAEWIVERSLKYPFSISGAPTERLIIAATLGDARVTCLEGESGVLQVLNRRGIKYTYKQSPRPMVIFEQTGAKIYCFGADTPNVARGMNAADAWMDEIIKWDYSYESWKEGIMPTLRANLPQDHPRAFVTTTPKPIKLLQEWLARTDGGVHMITGSTFDNAANLNEYFLAELKLTYEGTELGRQELYGEMLEAMKGALFKRNDLDRNRVTEPPDLISIVVGVDPSLVGDKDAMGVVVVGRSRDDHLYILADETIKSAGRDAALHCWRTLVKYDAGMVVYEENLGKKWMEQVFKDAWFELVKAGEAPAQTSPPMRGIDAKLGKKTRAEPVAMRSEQCVAMGSRVQLTRGDVPIQEVLPGDMVWTRRGARRVLDAWQTGVRETVIIALSDGRELCCTPDHLVYVEGRGFIEACTVVPGIDIMVSWSIFASAAQSPSPTPQFAVEAAPGDAPRRAPRSQVAASTAGSSFSGLEPVAVAPAMTRRAPTTAEPGESVLTAESRSPREVSAASSVPMPSSAPSARERGGSISALTAGMLFSSSRDTAPSAAEATASPRRLSERLSYSMGPGISRRPMDTGERHEGDAGGTSSCTMPSGNRRTDHSHLDGTFITSIPTRATTPSEISGECLPLSTRKSIDTPGSLIRPRPERSSPEAAGNGGSWRQSENLTAPVAEKSSEQRPLMEDSVPKGALTTITITAVRAGPTVPVFDIAVDRDHEFFAEGVLVHNCRMHMVGDHPDLEDELVLFTSWDGKESPNRLDAMVHACRHHMEAERNRGNIINPDDMRPQGFGNGFSQGIDFGW